MSHPLLTTVASVLLAGVADAHEPAPSLPALRLHYVSAFASAPTVADPKPIDWLSSNARVGALQGHAGHWRTPTDGARP